MRARVHRQVRAPLRGPCCPSAASVPLAPPSCTIKASAKLSLSRTLPRRTAANQPAALSPNVTGGAALQQRSSKHDCVRVLLR